MPRINRFNLNILACSFLLLFYSFLLSVDFVMLTNTRWLSLLSVVRRLMPVLPYTPYTLSKHWIVHQLEEALLKITFGFYSHFCCHIYVLLQSGFLTELDHPKYFFQFQSMIHFLLQGFYGEDIVFLVVKITLKFLM